MRAALGFFAGVTLVSSCWLAYNGLRLRALGAPPRIWRRPILWGMFASALSVALVMTSGYRVG